MAKSNTLNLSLVVAAPGPWSPVDFGERVSDRISEAGDGRWHFVGGIADERTVFVQIEHLTRPTRERLYAVDAVLTRGIEVDPSLDRVVVLDPEGTQAGRLEAFLDAVDRAVAYAQARERRDASGALPEDAQLPADDLEALEALADVAEPATSPTPVSDVTGALAEEEAWAALAEDVTPAAPVPAEPAAPVPAESPSPVSVALPTRSDLPLAARLRRKETVVMTRRRRRRRVRVTGPIRITDESLY